MTEINNRIEEVKKLVDKFRWDYLHLKIYENCEPAKVNDLIASYSRQLCQLFPQPLTDEDVRKKMHDHINEMLAPIGLCLYRLTPTENSDDYGLADKDGDPIDIELVLKPTMDKYYKPDEEGQK